MTIREAARSLYDHINGSDGSRYQAGVGEAENIGTLYLFCETKRIAKGLLITEWEGYPVVVKVTGKMQLC